MSLTLKTAKTRQRQLNTIPGGEVRRKNANKLQNYCKTKRAKKRERAPSTCILRSHSYGLLSSHFLRLFTALLQLCASPILRSYSSTSLLSILPVFLFSYLLFSCFRFQSFGDFMPNSHFSHRFSFLPPPPSSLHQSPLVSTFFLKSSKPLITICLVINIFLYCC